MKLLVATKNNLLLLDDGCDCRQDTSIVNWKIVQERPGEWYGITWSGSTLYAAPRVSSCVYALDNDFGIREFISVPELHDVHQIYYWQGTLYITNTAYNQIIGIDPERKQVRIQCSNLFTKSGHKLVNGHEHINSIWCDNRYFYICEHRYGKPPVRIRLYNRTFTQMVDTIQIENMRQPHNGGIHNVYVEDDILYTLSVEKLLRIDTSTKEIDMIDVRSDRKVGYLRGFARIPGYFILGESQMCTREKRTTGNSRVIILDDNLRFVEAIELKDTGQLHDIRAIEPNDLAHNQVCYPYE